MRDFGLTERQGENKSTFKRDLIMMIVNTHKRTLARTKDIGVRYFHSKMV